MVTATLAQVHNIAAAQLVAGSRFRVYVTLAVTRHRCMQGLPRTMKRCLAGMKEVAWAVNEPGRAKMVLIAPNIQIPCPDSILLEQVLELVAKCRKADVPVIMGPSRKQLGMAFRTSGAPLCMHLTLCSYLKFVDVRIKACGCVYMCTPIPVDLKACLLPSPPAHNTLGVHPCMVSGCCPDQHDVVTCGCGMQRARRARSS